MSKAVRITEHVDGGWYEGDPPVWHDYPAKGDVMTTDDDHAASLVLSGRAEYVREAKPAKAQTATKTDGGEQRGGTPPAGATESRTQSAAERGAARGAKG